MAHCPFERLQDLFEVFEELRTWPAIREPRPGIFYVKRTAFLHFHIDGTGRRWADVRAGDSWGPQLDIPIGSSATQQKRFLSETRKRFEATAQHLGVALSDTSA